MNVIKIDNYNNLDEISVKTDSEFDCKLWTECIYLDEIEKNFFYKKTYEYLIEQLQYNGDNIITKFDKKKNKYF